MRKSVVKSIFSITVSVLVSASYAQTATNPGTTIISPDQFKSLSKQYNKQTQDHLNQSYHDAISSQKPIAPSDMPSLKSSDTNQNVTPPGVAPQSSAPTAAPNKPAAAAPAPTSDDDLAFPPASNTGSNNNAPNSSPAPAQSNQPYSGFGNGSGNSTPSNTTTPSGGSSGWGVKY